MRSTIILLSVLAALSGAHAEVFFTEDFEGVSDPAASSKFTVDSQSATLSIDTSNPKNGKKALRLDVTGNGRAFIAPKSFAPPGNSFFGRLNLFVQDYPIRPDFAHWINVELSGVGDGTLLRPVGGQFIPGQGTLFGVGADLGPTGDWTDHRPTAKTSDRVYQCIEYEVQAADNSVKVSVDGVPKPELTVNQTSHGGNQVDLIFPQFNQIKIGWQLFQQTTDNFTVFVDDIALSTTPIGCNIGAVAADCNKNNA